MDQVLEMPTLYERLSRAGFPLKFIQEKALPQWWDVELENDPVAVMEAAGRIAKRLGLDIASVVNPNAPISFKKASSPKFKKRQNTDEQRLFIAQGLATRVAEMVAYASKSPFKGIPKDPLEIRERILESKPWVDLDGLLRFCWSCGLPVVHFSDFPANALKMEGMAAILNGRPTAVVSSKQRFSARLLFIVAHELGHIACGHVTDGVLVDEDIATEMRDTEEDEANDFAVRLLFRETDKYLWAKKSIPLELARLSLKIANTDRVDPGVVALNYAWQKNDWGTGVGALKIIEPKPNAPAKINNYLDANLDWERLDRDSEEYLRLVTGV